MQPGKSLAGCASPWCGPHSATRRYGNHQQGLMAALSALLRAMHVPDPVLLKQPSDSPISTQSMAKEAPKTATLAKTFFKKWVFQEQVDAPGRTSHFLVLASFQPTKAYHRHCHRNFAGLENKEGDSKLQF